MTVPTPTRLKTVVTASEASSTVAFDEATALDDSYLLVAFVAVGANTTQAAAGWTTISSGAGASRAIFMFARRGDGAVNSITVTSTATVREVTVVAFPGFSSLTPLTSKGGSVASSPFTIDPGVTPAGAGVLLVGTRRTPGTGFSWTNGEKRMRADTSSATVYRTYDGTDATSTYSNAGTSTSAYAMAVLPLLPVDLPLPDDRLVRVVEEQFNNFAGTSVTLSFPQALLLDDTHLLVAVVAITTTATATASGWTELTAVQFVGTPALQVFVRRGNSLTNEITISTGNLVRRVVLMAFAGYQSLTPLVSSLGSTTTATSASLTLPSMPAGYGITVAAVLPSTSVDSWGTWSDGFLENTPSQTSTSPFLWTARKAYTGTTDSEPTITWTPARGTRWMEVVMPLVGQAPVPIVKKFWSLALGATPRNAILGAGTLRTSQLGAAPVEGAYEAAVLADGPTWYFPLNDASGVPDDQMNFATTAILEGAALTYGQPGLGDRATSTQFNDTSRIRIGQFPTGFTSVTAEVLVNVTAQVRDQFLVAQDEGGSGARSYRLWVPKGAPLFQWLAFGTGDVLYTLNGPSNVVMGRTYHVAGTYDGTTLKLYVDGLLAAQGPGGLPLVSTTQWHHIGAVGGGSFAPAPNGRLAGVAFYTKALSAGRILAHAQAAGRYAPPTGYGVVVMADAPTLYWRMGEVGAAPDVSGNGHYGNFSGFVVYSQPSLVTGDPDPATRVSSNGYCLAPYGAWQDESIFSAELLIKPASFPTHQALIGCDGNTGRFWSFYIDPSRHLYMHNQANGGPVATGVATLVAGTSYHVAVVADGTTVKLYLNGALDVSVNAAMAPQGTAGAAGTRGFMVGCSMAGSATATFPFDGVIDEVAYYAAPLSAARILAHAQAAGLA